MKGKSLLIAFFISTGLYGPENAKQVVSEMTEQEVIELLSDFQKSEVYRGKYASSPTQSTSGTGGIS